MHIKIKHIKQFLLIFSCISLAGFNYLAYVKAADTTVVTCDKSIDSDCDELTNAEEKLYRTNENNSDTDSDGYSDGVEVKSGYDPIKPAPGDRVTTIETALSAQNAQENSSLMTPTSSLTDSFIQNFKQFITSKDGQPISAEDIKSFNETEFAGKINAVTIDTLPTIDETQIEILSQNYSALSETEKKQKLQQDSIQYMYEVLYLLISNAPTPIANSSDLAIFQKDFESHLSDLTDKSNLDYFSDLGYRLEVFYEQFNDVRVPETMLGLHIKFARIIKGFLALRELSSSSSATDPMGKIITLNKARDLTTILSNFFTNDFADYFKQLSVS